MEASGPSPSDPPFTVDWIKTKDDSLDEDSKDCARTNAGEESSSWNGMDSVDWVKIGVGKGSSAQDPGASSERIKDEGEEQCTKDHPDLVKKQIKNEKEVDARGTETQSLNTVSVFEDEEKPLATQLATDHQISLKNEIIECCTKGNGAGPEAEKVQMNPKRWNIWSKKKNPTVDWQGVAPDLEKKLTLLHHRIIPHKECWETFTDRSGFLAFQSTDLACYRCTYCKTSFIRLSQFMTHSRMHTEEKPFPCSTCGECFTSNLILIKHKKSHTQGRYKCTECDKTFTLNSRLKYHIKTHTGEMPYKCPECTKSFNHPSELRSHEWIHTGEKPHKCTYCDKSFSNSTAMIYHQRIHTGEKPHKCTDCGKSFSRPFALAYHHRIHTGEKPYQCTECKKMFRDSSALLVHRRLHIGAKPFECTKCNKTFSRSSNLRLHQVTHTGEKPYKCKLCNKNFKRQATLISHQRLHKTQ